MCFITDHACERFLERELGYITWTMEDIFKTRDYLRIFISSHKHKNINKTSNRICHVLVDKLILVFRKAKKILVTLYPFSEKAIQTIITKSMYIEFIKNLPKKFNKLERKGRYPNPNLLSISMSGTKKRIHIEVNNPEKSYNLSGCFSAIEHAENLLVIIQTIIINIS